MWTIRAALSLSLLIALPATAVVAESKVRRDVPYAEPRSERRMLDVYSPAEGKGHPIVVWVHGGG